MIGLGPELRAPDPLPVWGSFHPGWAWSGGEGIVEGVGKGSETAADSHKLL